MIPSLNLGDWNQKEKAKQRRLPSPPPATLLPRTNAYKRRRVPTPPTSFTMQSPDSDEERFPGRYVVRLAGALAALLERAEGVELWEDELVPCLRVKGLITYRPSTRAQGLSPPHRLLVRLSRALAQELAGPYLLIQH